MAATSVAVLAIGLSTCTTFFAVLYAAVLRPLPYPQADRLIQIGNRFPSLNLPNMKGSAGDYALLRRHKELFHNLGAYYFVDLSRTRIQVPQKVNAVAATSSLFETLGVHPSLGRLFTTDEERYRGPHAVILSDGYWHSAFAADPSILHQSMVLNGESYNIVGVMPKGFAFPNSVTEMWVPVALRDPVDTRSYYLRMYGRLEIGFSYRQAIARLDQLSRATASRDPGMHALAPTNWSYTFSPLLWNDNRVARQWLWILFAASACFLLIVCSNVAALALTRSLERRSEFALRGALGATTGRLVLQALAEVLVISALSGVVSLPVSRMGIALLARLGPSAFPPDFVAPVFWFSAAAATLTAVLCSLTPIFHVPGFATDFVGAMADGTYQRTAGKDKQRWQHALVVLQIAVSTALLAGGGLFAHSLANLLNAPVGFDPRNVLTMEISLPPQRYADPPSRTRFYAAVQQQISSLPGVTGVAACTNLPFGFGESVNTFEIAGQPKQPGSPIATRNLVSSSYFGVMRIPILRGRSFTSIDADGPKVAIVDQTFAHRFFGQADPIGHVIKTAWASYQVVGIAGSAKASGIDVDSSPTLYFDTAQAPSTDMSIIVRGSLPESATLAKIQNIVAGIDKDQPVYDFGTLQSRIDRSLKTRRFVASLVLASAVAGSCVAALGLVGLLSYTFALRRREFGIRSALGATRGALIGVVFHHSLRLLLVGIGIGVLAAVSAFKPLGSLLYGVNLQDGPTWIATLITIGVIGLLATALPAWRIARQSVENALRNP